MTARSVLQVFDQYQKARICFVQTVADLAIKPQNVGILQSARVLDLLQPLLYDICPQIQQSAAVALGRLVDNSASIAHQLLEREILNLVLRDISKQNKYYKKAALLVLRGICKHNATMASAVAHAGGMEAIMVCLEDFEPGVKQNAAWALGYIAKHSASLAEAIVDMGAIPLLVLCLQEPELSLKQVATNTLSDIAKHSSELAQSVVDAGAVPHLARILNNQDEKLKRQVLAALSSIATHSNEMSEVVIEAEVFPSVLMHISHACPMVRKNAAILVRDIVKHSLELTQLIVNTGGVAALLENLRLPSDETKVPCITALGYIAGHSEHFAMSMLGCQGAVELTYVLNNSSDDSTLAVTAWTLGQIAKHSPEHSKALAAADAYSKLLEMYISENSSQDLKYKCKTALKQCLQKCLVISAIEPLVYNAPPTIMKYILGQYSKILPNDAKARRMFVSTGGLKKVQEINAEPGSTIMEYITIINACFPEEVVRYYSPGYDVSLLEKVEQYSPQLAAILHDTNAVDSEIQANVAKLRSSISSTASSQELEAMIESKS